MKKFFEKNPLHCFSGMILPHRVEVWKRSCSDLPNGGSTPNEPPDDAMR